MKTRVDLIVKGKYLITLGSKGLITRGAVAVKDGVIVDVDTEDRISGRYSADDVLERRDHVLMPGFLDCHTHTQQLFLRSVITDRMLQLPPIWTKLLVPFERRLGSELAKLSSLMAVVGMVKNGVTSFIEACAPYPEALIEAVREVGVRGAVTYAAYDIVDSEVLDTKGVIRNLEELLKLRGDGRVKVWLSIRQIMMSSDELMEAFIEYAKKYRPAGLTIHLAEYQGEVDYSLTKSGLRPLEYLDKLGLTSVKPFVIAHGIFMSPKEAELVRERGLGVCWCPTVDSWLMGPHWAGYLDKDVLLGIGSDGAAFSTLDMLHEVKVARAVSKALSNALTYTKTSLTSERALKALTGSRGAMFGERVGAIEEGFMADIIAINTKTVRALPIASPLELVTNFLEGRDVTDVLVGGKLIVSNGKVLTVNEEELVSEVLDRSDRILGLLEELKKELEKRYGTL